MREIINASNDSNPVRILFLALDVNLSGTMGDTTHVRELASSFCKLGNEISLVGYLPPGSKPDRILCQGGMHLHTPDLSGDLSTLKFCLSLAKKFEPDVVYERRFSPKIGVTLGKIVGVPSIVEINAMIEEEKRIFGRDEGDSGVERIKRRIRRYFLRSASAIVAVSEGIREGLVNEYSLPPSKIHVIHNGANTTLFRPMDRSECLEKTNLKRSLRYICFSGNLAPWQGVETLVHAMPSVIHQISNTHLLLVGDGPLRKNLEALVGELGLEDAVHFIGRVRYEEVPIYLNASEVCVAPFSGILRNVKYGFSAIKLYEYMACGKPFVTTNVCGIEDEISKNKVGVVVDPDDPDALAGALIRIMKDEDAIHMGERGRLLAVKEHSWEIVAGRIMSLLEEVVKG